LAISNQRAMDKILDEMREVTQKVILETPETPQLLAKTKSS